MKENFYSLTSIEKRLKFVVWYHQDLLTDQNVQEQDQQGRSQEFDLGGYKWVKETKQPYKKHLR